MKIEKGIPIPPRNRKTPVHVEHLAAMGVGDSISVPIPYEYVRKPSSWANTNRIRNAAYTYGKKNNKSFTVRIMDGVVRIWRTA